MNQRVNTVSGVYRQSLDLRTTQGRNNFRWGLRWLRKSKQVRKWWQSYGKYMVLDTLKRNE